MIQQKIELCLLVKILTSIEYFLSAEQAHNTNLRFQAKFSIES